MSKVSKKELWQAVKEVLFREWDPIGINYKPAWDDEYDSYIAAIVRLLQNEADEYQITKHLHELQRVNMGLSSPDEERDRHIARRLINLVR